MRNLLFLLLFLGATTMTSNLILCPYCHIHSAEEFALEIITTTSNRLDGAYLMKCPRCKMEVEDDET